MGCKNLREKILLVEDEVAIANSVAYTLTSDGYQVSKAFNGIDALSLFSSIKPDLVILDIMLPNLDGIEVCKLIRAESNTPIIMLTARSEESDKVDALNLGADDYVTKPFGSRELLSRVRSLLRRNELSKQNIIEFEEPIVIENIIEFGKIVMDVENHVLRVNGILTHLPVKQFNILTVFMHNPGKVFTREEIFKLCWDEEIPYETALLDVHINQLREKLESLNSFPTVIKTVRGIGYRLVEINENHD